MRGHASAEMPEQQKRQAEMQSCLSLTGARSPSPDAPPASNCRHGLHRPAGAARASQGWESLVLVQYCDRSQPQQPSLRRLRMWFSSISNRSKENPRFATSVRKAAFVREVPFDSIWVHCSSIISSSTLMSAASRASMRRCSTAATASSVDCGIALPFARQ